MKNKENLKYVFHLKKFEYGFCFKHIKIILKEMFEIPRIRIFTVFLLLMFCGGLPLYLYYIQPHTFFNIYTQHFYTVPPQRGLAFMGFYFMLIPSVIFGFTTLLFFGNCYLIIKRKAPYDYLKPQWEEHKAKKMRIIEEKLIFNHSKNKINHQKLHSVNHKTVL